MTTFFKQAGEVETDFPNTVFATRLAKLLIGIRRTQSANTAKWADEFRILRKTRTVAEIETVLAWLEDHASDKYTPKVFSASSFRAKFDQLAAAVCRGTVDWNSLPAVEVSDSAKLVSMRLGNLNWPATTKQQELQAIEYSLRNYRAFLIRLIVAKRPGSPLEGIASHLLAVGGDPLVFVESWFADLHSFAWRKPEWPVNMARSVVRIDSDRFKRRVNGWLQEYRGEGDWFSWLMERI